MTSASLSPFAGRKLCIATMHRKELVEHIHGCPVCPERALRPRSDGLTHAEPGQCAWCNP